MATDSTAANEQSKEVDQNVVDAMMAADRDKGILDIQCIKEYIDIEFDTISSFLVLRWLCTIYVFSMLDVITDILFTLRISSITGNGCAYQLIQYGAIDIEFAPTIIFLWLSTISAIVYTVYCKYYAAYKASKQHNITYWNGLKYIAVVTQLNLHMRYSSSCWNKYQLMRILIVLLEDVIQLAIGLIFIASTNTDIIIWLSTILSAMCIVYTMSYVCYRAFHDVVRKMASCCGCRCTKCRCVEGMCQCCCINAPVIAVVILLVSSGVETLTRSANVYVDYGFMYADVEFYIDELHVDWVDLYYPNVIGEYNVTTSFEIYNHSIQRSIFGQTRDSIYCIDSVLMNVDKYVSLDCLNDPLRAHACDSFVFVFENSSNVEYPVICFKVLNKHLVVYFANRDDVYHEKDGYGGSPLRLTSNEPLEVDNDEAVTRMRYPGDFRCVHLGSLRDQTCDRSYNLADGSNWSMSYKFTNVVPCEAV